MKLYLLTQDENNDYDTYDACVVAAENEDAAKMILPSKYEKWGEQYGGWASTPENVKVAYLGEAKEGTKAGVILASFHAG